MMRRMFQWMFGKRDADGRGDPNRIYRVLFWLLLLGVAITLVAVFYKEWLYILLAFIAGALCGILLERRRRRRLLREAELEDPGWFGRRKKKAGAESGDSQKKPDKQTTPAQAKGNS